MALFKELQDTQAFEKIQGVGSYRQIVRLHHRTYLNVLQNPPRLFKVKFTWETEHLREIIDGLETLRLR